MTRLGAHDVVELIADPGSWQSWDRPLIDVTADAQYAEELAHARAKTGLDEAVITGAASIRGRRVAMLLCDFRFLGGSIGIAAGDRLTSAWRRPESPAGATRSERFRPSRHRRRIRP
jgi:acyl-CoA carboxylase subunit beta